MVVLLMRTASKAAHLTRRCKGCRGYPARGLGDRKPEPEGADPRGRELSRRSQSMSMTAWVSYASSVEAMKAISSTPGLCKVFGHLAGMPYNREDPDRTVCWLFPGSK